MPPLGMVTERAALLLQSIEKRIGRRNRIMIRNIAVDLHDVFGRLGKHHDVTIHRRTLFRTSANAAATEVPFPFVMLFVLMAMSLSIARLSCICS